MEAIKYLKTRERLCRDNKCEYCPLYEVNNGTNMVCTKLEEEMPEKMVKMVEEWAKENPGVTRMSEFIEEHPNAKTGKYKKEKFVDICPQKIDNEFKCRIEGCYTAYTENCYDCKIQYWNEEVE